MGGGEGGGGGGGNRCITFIQRFERDGGVGQIKVGLIRRQPTKFRRHVPLGSVWIVVP